MPIYEYQCHKCKEVTEALQKFSDKPLVKCPQCGGHLSKLMSMNSFQLKGGGWYVTDYANKKTDGDSGSSHKNASPVKTEKKADNAPAKKKPPKSDSSAG